MPTLRDWRRCIDSEEGTHGDDNPQSLDEPSIEKPSFRLLDLSEPGVLLRFKDTKEEKWSQSSRPNNHHQPSDDLLQIEWGIGEQGNESDGEKGEASGEIVILFWVVEQCGDKRNNLHEKGVWH